MGGDHVLVAVVGLHGFEHLRVFEERRLRALVKQLGHFRIAEREVARRLRALRLALLLRLAFLRLLLRPLQRFSLTLRWLLLRRRPRS